MLLSDFGVLRSGENRALEIAPVKLFVAGLPGVAFAMPIRHDISTAVINLLMAAQCFYLALRIRRLPSRSVGSVYWYAGYLIIGGGSVLATIYHAIDLPLWLFRLIYVGIIALAGTLFLAVAFDTLPARTAARLKPALIGLAVLLLVAVQLEPDRLPLVAGILGFTVLVGIVQYILRWRDGTLPGAGWMAGGMILTLTGIVLMVLGVGFNFIWALDHNGVYHVFQMTGLLLFYLGLRLRPAYDAAARGSPFSSMLPAATSTSRSLSR